jgi:hypothetical protein
LMKFCNVVPLPEIRTASRGELIMCFEGSADRIRGRRLQ